MGGLVYRGFVTGNGFNDWATRCDICRQLKNDWKNCGRSTSRPCSDAESRKRPAGGQQWINKLPPARREDEDVKESAG